VRLFRGKGGAAPGARRAHGSDAASGGVPAHRLTLDLARAEKLAAMLAKSRASRAVDVADLLAGMYISNWERLSQYWEERRHEEVETFLRGMCRISPQRWHSWIEFYDGERRKEQGLRGWRPLRHWKKAGASDKPAQLSAALASVLRQAEQITPFYERTNGRSIPILTTECVLLCIARSYGSQISRKLAVTGLDTTKLEQRALSPKRAPLV
jgi:hypothetical protein